MTLLISQTDGPNDDNAKVVQVTWWVRKVPSEIRHLEIVATEDGGTVRSHKGFDRVLYLPRKIQPRSEIAKVPPVSPHLLFQLSSGLASTR
jgi:hypothetical protein